MESTLQSIRPKIQGDYFDSDLVKALYATDASVYRELPTAVALPKSAEDIKVLIQFAKIHKLSIIPRAAGTSLAGQCVGNGIIVDVSKYMNSILEINTNEGWVRVEPGVGRDELNYFLKPYGYYFGPNTSTSNRCTIGGMVGNNSCGSTSIVYGSTREHTIALTTVLSDGSTVTFKAIQSKEEFKQLSRGETLEAKLYRHIYNELSSLEVRQAITSGFPKASIPRRNTGYAVDALMETNIFSDTSKQFNLAKLLCGSEGTLAFITEIKLNIVPLPKPKVAVLNIHFDAVKSSLQAALVAMQHQPTACELMDKTILDCTKHHLMYQHNRFFIKGDPKALLMVEFRSDTDDQLLDRINTLKTTLQHAKLGYAYTIVKGDETKKVWDLRKAGLGLLSNMKGDKKAVACIEDTAVALEDLPDYIEAFTALMKTYGQKAVYYAHAGAGELHLRPILNLKSSTDVRLFRQISEDSAKLVKSFNGALSGEHGDGRVRSEFIPLVLGEENYQLLKRIKTQWDPSQIFNPGKIVDALPMDTQLRYDDDQNLKPIPTVFNFEGGILNTVEKCNGSGDCRKLSFAGGTMCPSFRATLDEQDSTRGRANALREFLTQNTKDNPFDHPEINEVMDLCISCKACKSECPSNIDMATLKAEFLHQYRQTHGTSIRDWIVAHTTPITKRFHRFSKLYNIIIQRSFFKVLLGFHSMRSLPKLQSITLSSWFKSYKQGRHTRQVYLFCDEFTNFYDAEIGKKAVKLLNLLGFEVLMDNYKDSGRTYISKGFLKQAKSLANSHVTNFSNLVSETVPLLGIEPSALLSFRDEYLNLVDKPLRAQAQKLKSHTFLIEEFLAKELRANRIDSSIFTTNTQHIIYHAHCHQKALSSLSDVKTILSAPKNYEVTILDTGCCGMAGSFGYEKEHYDLSLKMGSDRLFPALKNAKDSTIISASGTSCRHQIRDGVQKTALHPIEVLYEAIK